MATEYTDRQHTTLPLSYDSHGDPFPATNWEPVDSGHSLDLREMVSLAS